jgi:hypothetical protein
MAGAVPVGMALVAGTLGTLIRKRPWSASKSKKNLTAAVALHARAGARDL